ncbi:MAG: PH domain-containing protein [bacterium]
MIFSLLLAAIFLLGSFFFLFPLLRVGFWGVILLFALFLFGIFLVVRIVLLRALNVLIVTNLRLIDIDQRGFFHREVSEATYEKIQDVSFSLKGVAQTLFRYGNVLIQTAGVQANLEVQNVRHPERIQELITKVQTESQQQKTPGSSMTAEELLELVQKLKEGLGDDVFRKLIRKP